MFVIILLFVVTHQYQVIAAFKTHPLKIINMRWNVEFWIINASMICFRLRCTILQDSALIFDSSIPNHVYTIYLVL